MPLPVIADVFRVAILFQSTFGIVPVNVLNVRTSALDSDGLAGSIEANWVTNMYGCCSNAISAVTLQITPLDGATAATNYSIGPHAGAGGSSAVPAAAGVLSIRTAQRGPRGRGRLYLPCVSEDNMLDGQLDSAARAAVETAWNDFKDGLDVDGVEMGVASYKHADFNVQTSLTVDSLLGTQRRRQDQLR